MSAPADRPRICPICGEDLLEVERENVLVDACPEHGLFLDHGELAELERRGTKGVRLGAAERTRKARKRVYERARTESDEYSLLSWLLGGVPKERPKRGRSTENVRKHNAPQIEHQNELVVPENERLCPVCGVRMATEERKDVWGRTQTILVDVCEEHGVWLDHSELEILLDRAEQDARRQLRYRRNREIDAAEREGRAHRIRYHDGGLTDL